ncbi:hypothetical protein MC56_022460 [Enterobacter hormaechei]|nr:hypothetical protein MC56_022460 [Enterobacter hormaechei]
MQPARWDNNHHTLITTRLITRRRAVIFSSFCILFEGIPKELPQIFHLTQDFFMTYICSMRTISFKIVVYIGKK